MILVNITLATYLGYFHNLITPSLLEDAMNICR